MLVKEQKAAVSDTTLLDCAMQARKFGKALKTISKKEPAANATGSNIE